MSAILVGNDLVHYEILGRGRPIVLVHGWLGSWRYWIPTMQQLHMRYRVYALDLFGHGDSGNNPDRYSVPYQAEMLKEFMKQLGMERAVFVGHGLGAMVVAEFAFKHQKQRVHRALLVSTPLFDIGGLPERTPRRVSRSASKVDPGDPDRTIPSSSLADTIPSAGMIRAAILERHAVGSNRNGDKIPSPIARDGADDDTTHNPLANQLRTNDLMTLLERSFSKTEVEYSKLRPDVEITDARVLETTVKEYDAGKMLDTVQQLTMPTVLIHGQEDRLLGVPDQPVWDYVTQPDSTIEILIPGVGHFPMLELERFGRLVNDFLETPDVTTLEIRERWRRRSR
jgi:pimeloyl-ACP methyl ester carboxylesterase